MPDPALLTTTEQFCKPAAGHKLCEQMCDPVTWCYLTKSLSEGETADEALQEQCFLWERGALVGADFDLFKFQDLL